MAKRTWEFDVKGNKHTVQLKHGTFSGKREIWVDGQLIMKVRNFVDYGSQNPFTIDEVPCELGITTNGFTYDYYLMANGQKVNAIGQKRNLSARATRKAVAEVEFWQKLADLSSLKYQPTPTANAAYRHRLIGTVRGYLVIVCSGLFGLNDVPSIHLLLRIAPLLDIGGTREKLKEEFRELQKRDKRIKADSLNVQGNFVEISMVYQAQKETPQVAFSRIVSAIDAFTRHVRPLSTDVCEGTECASRVGQELNFVFVNGFPTYLCHDCIQRIPSQAQKVQEEYKKAPSGLLKGLVAGLSAAIAGGLVWAIVAVFLDRIASAIAALILLLVIKAMDKVGTKRTVWSILLGGMLSTIGVVVGVFFTYAVYGFMNYPEYSATQVFQTAWNILWEFDEFFVLSLFFGLIGIVPYVWTLGSGTKKQIAQIAEPHIEFIEELD